MINNYIKKMVFVLLLFIMIYFIILVFPQIYNVVLSILSIFLPVFIAFVIAFVLDPFVIKIDKKINNRKLSVMILLLSIILILALFLIYIIPKLKYQFMEFKEILPILIEEIKILINGIINDFNNILGVENSLFSSKIGEKIDIVLTSFFDIGKNFAKNIFYILSMVFIVPIISIYFLIDFENITKSVKNFLKLKNKERLLNYIADLSLTMRVYIKGLFIVMFILFILFTIAFTFLRLPYSLVFSLIIAITNVIPYIGSYLGAILPVLFALGDSFTKALVTIIVCVLIQSVEANLITPMVQKKYTEIKPLYTIVSLIVFGNLFGIIGMILAIPILNVIKITFKHYPIKFLSINNK